MNSAMRATKSSADPGDHVTVRSDASGRLLIGSMGTGFADFNTLITTAPAYGANDNVGGEIATAPAGTETAALTPYILQSLTVVDPQAQTAHLAILFFAAAASAHGATIADNAAFAYGAGTAAALLGVFEITAADWKTVSGKQIATLSNLGLLVKTDVVSQIYSAVIALDTPNFGNGFLHVKGGYMRLG